MSFTHFTSSSPIQKQFNRKIYILFLVLLFSTNCIAQFTTLPSSEQTPDNSQRGVMFDIVATNDDHYQQLRSHIVKYHTTGL